MVGTCLRTVPRHAPRDEVRYLAFIRICGLAGHGCGLLQGLNGGNPFDGSFIVGGEVKYIGVDGGARKQLTAFPPFGIIAM